MTKVHQTTSPTVTLFLLFAYALSFASWGVLYLTSSSGVFTFSLQEVDSMYRNLMSDTIHPPGLATTLAMLSVVLGIIYTAFVTIRFQRSPDYFSVGQHVILACVFPLLGVSSVMYARDKLLVSLILLCVCFAIMAIGKVLFTPYPMNPRDRIEVPDTINLLGKSEKTIFHSDKSFTYSLLEFVFLGLVYIMVYNHVIFETFKVILGYGRQQDAPELSGIKEVGTAIGFMSMLLVITLFDGYMRFKDGITGLVISFTLMRVVVIQRAYFTQILASANSDHPLFNYSYLPSITFAFAIVIFALATLRCLTNLANLVKKHSEKAISLVPHYFCEPECSDSCDNKINKIY